MMTAEQETWLKRKEIAEQKTINDLVQSGLPRVQAVAIMERTVR